MLTVIVPASNEADLICGCLEALLASTNPQAMPWQLLVVANGCRDDTATVARSYAARARQAGVDLVVIEIERGDKLNAINIGETHAKGDALVYVDADVVVQPKLLHQLALALAGPGPTYATGALQIAAPKTWVTRTYARFWCRLPFVVDGAAGCGVFAVNRLGRDRWAKFPPIISDDTFVRLHFAPAERISVPAGFSWPMVEGFANLVRVRRRQDRGVQEIVRDYPQLIANEGKSTLRPLRLALVDPIGFAVYCLVALMTKLPSNTANRWVRGR